MCPPVLLVASMAVSGLSAVAEYGAKQAQFKAETNRYNQNITNSLAAQRDASTVGAR